MITKFALATSVAALALAAGATHGNMMLGLSAGGGGGGFTPASLTDLAAWYDPSDTTTVFTDSGCSTPAVTGDPVGCIKDKSAAHCDATATGTNRPILTISGGLSWLAFNGVSSFPFLTISSCAAIFQNVGYAVVTAGAQSNAATTGQAFYASLPTAGGGSTFVRFGCGFDFNGTGWGIRARRLDTDGAVDLATGSENTAALVVRCDGRYAAATASVFVNNASVASSGSWLTAGTTSNTASEAVNIGTNNNGTFLSGKIYGIVVQKGATAPSSTDLTNTSTWMCPKVGTTC